VQIGRGANLSSIIWVKEINLLFRGKKGKRSQNGALSLTPKQEPNTQQQPKKNITFLELTEKERKILRRTSSGRERAAV